jgi:LuxR family transcriptional regulator, maltose regulon positive regulatory protein
MLSSLLATKLHLPSAPFKWVERPRLIHRLNEGLAAGRRLTLVSAPAGFGKTTCVCEWLQSLDVPVSWLALDPADNDCGRFLAYMVATLQKVDGNLGRDILDLLAARQPPPIESLTTALLNEIEETDHQFFLVLDDFQLLRESVVLQVVERLLANQSANLHLILVTREDPMLPLARLRANNQLTEIRAGDLRFTGDEADRFLTHVMDLALSQADMARLADRTEGWIAGLQLAGLSARGRADPSDFIATLSGSHRYILSYLTEEVLSRQPEEIQSFLLQTSILDRLNGALCNAVTGRADGDVLLERLFHANLFLIALDDDGQWYRYHHLFSDLLAARLRQTTPEADILALHRGASTWLAQHGYFDEAVQHAVAGKDYEQAAVIVGRAARSMMFSGQVNLLKQWLEALPETSFQLYPRLSLYRNWIDLVQGKSDLSEPALQRLDAALRALPASPENDTLRMEMIVILCRFVAIAGNTSRAIALAHEALELLPDSDLGSRAHVHSALAIAYGMEGQAEEGRRSYRECLSLAQASGNYTLAAHTMLLMGMWQCHYGQLSEAARSYQAIIELGEQAQQRVFFPAGQGYIGLADICLERYDLQSAQDYLTQGMALCGQAGLDGVFMGHMLRSRLCQARGDLVGALEELHPLEQAFPRDDNSFLMAIRQVQARLAAGDGQGVARWAVPLAAMLDADPAARPPVVVLEIVQAIIARVCLAQGEIERAMRLLDELAATAEPGERRGRLIEVELLRALALERQNLEYVNTVALEHFAHALDLAEPEGYVTLFLEEGPDVVPLLKAALNQRAAPERRKAYAAKLLGVFSGRSNPATSPAVATTNVQDRLTALGEGPEMIEPLSKRELEILRLICEGRSNREIAEQLFITVSAVKKHTGNIYGKLQVNSRTQAIARSHQMGLFSVAD